MDRIKFMGEKKPNKYTKSRLVKFQTVEVNHYTKQL